MWFDRGPCATPSTTLLFVIQTPCFLALSDSFLRTGFILVAAGILALAVGAGCQTLREVAALKDVKFRLDGVRDARLAGIELRSIQSYEDFGIQEVGRLTSTLARGEMPLSFTAQVEATNPEGNSVTARLTSMDWTLFLQDRETISGVVDEDIRLAPGTPTTVPVSVSLDLVRFFDDNLRSLADLAMAVAGRGPETVVSLRVNPTIRTPLGPMEPGPITVGRRSVGGEGQNGPE